MTMAANSRRLSILSAAEVDDLYGLPNFTPDERGLYFDLSAKESDAGGFCAHGFGCRAFDFAAWLLQGQAPVFRWVLINKRL